MDFQIAGHSRRGAAGDRALYVTVREVDATAAFYAGNPRRALDSASDGLAHVRRGPVAARLVAHQAHAHAALGERNEALRGVERGYTLVDQLDPGRWGEPHLSFDWFHPVDQD